jgi:hypothetical protein
MFGQSLLSAFGSAACTTDTDQLFTTDVQTTSVATYQLNNATTSIPSNTYPGTPSNITYAAGKFGNAAVFNGSNSSILATSPTQGNTDASYSFWIKTPTILSYNNTNPNYPVFGQVSDALRNPFSIYWHASTTSGKMAFGIWRCFNNQIWYPTGYFTDFEFTYVANTWYHIVITYTASDKSCRNYVNGTQIGAAPTLTLLGSNITTGTQMKLGSYNNNQGVPFDGSIDQIRIFNSVLPQAAVTALYNETTTTATYDYVEYETPNPNSIAYYKMSDATDQLGNYNGTATNVNFNTEGKFGFAGAFNGTSSTIATPITTNYSNLSISCWVKFDALPTGGADATLVSKGFYTSGSSTQYLHLRYEDYLSKGFTFAIRNNSAYNSQAIAGVTATVGVWYHVVGILDSSGNAQIYVNGVAGTGITGAPSMTNSNAFEIGSFISTSALLNGSIDQIRIYDSALSAANVTALYNEIECPAVAVTNAFNTVLYTGNGNNNRAITGVGFKPDFTWIKKRSGTAAVASHILQDSVRGTAFSLYSDLTNAEGNTNALSSFDSDGFTIGTSYDGTNGNGNNIVSWNWKAPLANLSTSFNGSSSEIVAANSILPSSGGFAISWWQKTTQSDTTYSYTIDTGGGSLGNGIYIITHNVSTGLIIGFKNGSTFGSSSIPYTSSERKQWTHFCFSWDGTTSTDAFKIYKNNVATSFTSTVTNGGSAYPFRIGRSYNGTDWLGGSIGQVRIYSSALSASEVSDLYAEPAASNNTLNYPAGAGCIAAYPLQTDAVDLSGNYNGASSNVTFGQPGYLTQNTEGTITSTVAANVDAGFSIVKWTGTEANATIGHGIDTPELIIIKNASAVKNWTVYSSNVGATKYGKLNLTDDFQTASTAFNNTDSTSSVFSVGSASVANGNGNTMIAYCFHSVPGYSKVGSYTGTGASGNFIYTGFQTSYVMTKNIDDGAAFDRWYIQDSVRGGGKILYADESLAEGNYTSVQFDSNGFTLNTTDTGINESGKNYIFLAIA